MLIKFAETFPPVAAKHPKYFKEYGATIAYAQFRNSRGGPGDKSDNSLFWVNYVNQCENL